MPRRWERELEHLKDVEAPTARIRERAKGGSSGSGGREPQPSGRQRVMAGVVAFAVFLAAGAFAWRAFRPGTRSVSGPTVSKPSLELSADLSSYAGRGSPADLRLAYGDLLLSVPVRSASGAGYLKRFPPLRDIPNVGPGFVWGSRVDVDLRGATATLVHAGTWGLHDSDVSDLIADGALPGPGSYVLDVHAAAPNGSVVRWLAQVGIGHLGDVHFWLNDQAPSGDVPPIEMVVDGLVTMPGNLDAQDPNALAKPEIADRIPALSDAARVRSGAPVSPPALSLNRGTVGHLTWAGTDLPYARLGVIDLGAHTMYPTLTAPPGTHYLRLEVDMPAFVGDLIYPVVVSSSGPPGSPSPAPLGQLIQGRTWVLTAIDDALVPADAEAATLEFMSTRLGGFDGCNTYGAGYRLLVDSSADSRIDVRGRIISTLIGCRGPIRAREDALLHHLQDAQTLTVQDDNLTIESSTGSLAFTDPLALGCVTSPTAQQAGDYQRLAGHPVKGDLAQIIEGLLPTDALERIDLGPGAHVFLIQRAGRAIGWVKIAPKQVSWTSCEGIDLSVSQPPP